MNAWFRRRLGTRMIGFIPAVIKKNKNGFYFPFLSAIVKILVHPFFKSLRILLPGQVMQKYPHAVESDRLCKSQIREMVAVSKVSACHISSWFTAVLGIKSQPLNQPFAAYHSRASFFVHTGRAVCAVTSCKKQRHKNAISNLFI